MTHKRHKIKRLSWRLCRRHGRTGETWTVNKHRRVAHFLLDQVPHGRWMFCSSLRTDILRPPILWTAGFSIRITSPQLTSFSRISVMWPLKALIWLSLSLRIFKRRKLELNLKRLPILSNMKLIWTDVPQVSEDGCGRQGRGRDTARQFSRKRRRRRRVGPIDKNLILC